MAFLGLALLLSLAPAALAGDDVLLKPSGSGAASAGLVMLQGASIEAAQYAPMVRALQEELLASHGIALWAAVPQYALSAVNPATIAGGVTRSLAALKSAGMPADAPLFMSGHSLGGAMLEVYAHDHGPELGVQGVVFMGSFVSRSRRDAASGRTSYPLATLTLAGELDGLSRVTRNGAEAFYQQITKATDASAAALNAAVVVLPGVSHMQFASGSAPALVRARDLEPEVTYDEAHADIAKVAASFIAAHAGGAEVAAPAAAALSARVSETETFLAPLVAAFELEGSQHFNLPCNSDFPTNPTCAYPSYPGKSLVPGTFPSPPKVLPPTDCTCGSPWVAQTAEPIMSGWSASPDPASGAHAVSRDAFHDVSDVRPFHLPHIFNVCASPSGCTLNSTTVTMPVLETLDAKTDTGFFSNSAFELRTKFKSREAMWQAANFSADAVDYEKTDASASTCRMINQAAYDWALQNAGAAASARFKAKGEPYVMVEDVDAPVGVTGPTWIKKALEFNRVSDSGSSGGVVKTHIEVASPFFAIKNKNNGDEPYLKPVGYHYCKLLSPARAMEWIYVDSLREYASLSNASSNDEQAEDEARCCDACTKEGEVKYHSVDTPHGHCGECCMNPKKYSLYKIFEKNLTLSTSDTPCKDLGWPKYDSTVTHGFGPVSMTLDLFDHDDSSQAVSAGGGGCSDLPNTRSAKVTGGAYDPSALVGVWYEAAFKDPAQIGASCPTLNFTFAPSTGVLEADLKVKYGPLPFTIKEIYTPTDATSAPGVYMKNADMPGGKLLTIPSVVSDYDDEVLILYSCKAIVKEVVIATRKAAPTASELEGYKARASALGIDASGLKTVDWSKC